MLSSQPVQVLIGPAFLDQRVAWHRNGDAYWIVSDAAIETIWLLVGFSVAVPTYPPSLRDGWQPGKFRCRAGVMGGMKGRPAAVVLAVRRSPRFRGRGDEADGQGDQVSPALSHRGQRPVMAAVGEVATHHAAVAPGDHTGGGPARTGRDDERREAAEGPIVDEKIVARRVCQGGRYPAAR